MKLPDINGGKLDLNHIESIHLPRKGFFGLLESKQMQESPHLCWMRQNLSSMRMTYLVLEPNSDHIQFIRPPRKVIKSCFWIIIIQKNAKITSFTLDQVEFVFH